MGGADKPVEAGLQGVALVRKSRGGVVGWGWVGGGEGKTSAELFANDVP